MRIVIIGGTGLTGPHIVRFLVSLGHDVMVYHRGQTLAELPAGVKRVLGDRTRLADHASELRGFGPDVVLHMVATTEQHAQALMDVFRGIARRVVAISSQDVYRAYGRLINIEPGPPEPVPLTEEAPLRER